MTAIPASARIVLDTEIPARVPWSAIIRKGQTLRIVDSHGQQAVDTLFYAADDHDERYSGQDTLRAQGSAYVSTGTQIMSTEGRVMLPGDLLSHASIAEQAVFAGFGSTFQIWEPGALERHLSEARDRIRIQRTTLPTARPEGSGK